jgi:hypothetical protein
MLRFRRWPDAASDTLPELRDMLSFLLAAASRQLAFRYASITPPLSLSCHFRMIGFSIFQIRYWLFH